MMVKPEFLAPTPFFPAKPFENVAGNFFVTAKGLHEGRGRRRNNLGPGGSFALGLELLFPISLAPGSGKKPGNDAARQRRRMPLNKSAGSGKAQGPGGKRQVYGLEGDKPNAVTFNGQFIGKVVRESEYVTDMPVKSKPRSDNGFSGWILGKGSFQSARDWACRDKKDSKRSLLTP
jgi:hypothetical protein